MPVSVTDMNVARQIGINTAWSALIRDPAVGPGTGRANAGSQQFDGGTASVNLRNLGTNRTLTLIDGQRRVSGSARTSAVDLNMIPAGMIDRIEVITGGAAAIYGADAVTGAVNVITKRSVKGLQLSATQNLSQRGDAPGTALSMVTGAEFADGRGAAILGATYVNSAGLINDRRSYADRHIVYQSNPASTGPSDGVPDSIIYRNWAATRLNRFPTFVANNRNYVFLNGAVRQQSIDRISTPGEYTAGTTNAYYVEGTYPLNAGEQLQSPLEQAAFIARGEYDLGPAIKFTARAEYGHTRYDGTRSYIREDSRNTWLNGAGGATAYLDNPYLPGPIRQFMVDNRLSSLRLARIFPEMGIRRDVQTRNTITLAGELGGALVGKLKWNGFVQHGRAVNHVANPGTLRANRWIAARDVVADPATGAPVCRDVAARAAGCIAYNVFDTAPPTAAQRDWLFATRRERWANSQTIFGGSIVGPVADLPYGTVSVAVGAEHRRDRLDTQEDPLAVPGELAHASGVSQHAEIAAALAVSELYGELVVPLLRDLPIARRLEVEGAYRLSGYNRFGRTGTWKAGLTWSPFDGLTLRSVRSRSVRVPNFGELYEPVNIGVTNLDDPCERQNVTRSQTRVANCRALGIASPGLASQLTSLVTTGGNPDLDPETSNSLTLGAILQPRFLRGVDVTVDYWDIDIDDVVTQFSGNQIANYCVDLPTVDNIFCKAVTRDASDPVRAIATVRTQQINASNLKARGVDVGVALRRPMGGGRITIGGKATYLIDKATEAVPGIAESVLKQAGESGNPRIRANLYATYQRGGWTLNWNAQYRGRSLHDANTVTDEAFDTNRVPPRSYHDVSVGYDVGPNYRLIIGINNLFDAKPPQVPDTYMGAGGAFDTIGRSGFITASAQF